MAIINPVRWGPIRDGATADTPPAIMRVFTAPGKPPMCCITRGGRPIYAGPYTPIINARMQIAAGDRMAEGGLNRYSN